MEEGGAGEGSAVTQLGKLAIVAGGVASLAFGVHQWWILPDTLVQAARRGHIRQVRLLLALGVNPNRSVSGRTALMAAAESGSKGAMQVLLDRGADPSLRDDDGNTALVRAARLGQTRAVRMLLERGSTSEQDVDRALAAAVGHAAAECVALLRKAGVTPAGRVAALIVAARKGSPPAMRDLIADGADVNGRDPAGRTALMYGWGPELDVLLAAGAQVNLQDAQGSTALMEATRRPHVADVELLLRHGAHPNLANRNGETALMLAVEDRNVAMATALLDGGADPNARNRWAETPLYLARSQRNAALQDVIAARGGVDERDPAKRTFAPGSPDPLARLDAVHDAERRRVMAEGALRDAVAGRRPALVRTLLDRGTDPNAITKDGKSILIHAIEQNDPTLVQLLLERGADPNLAGRQGFTPLLRAVAHRKSETVALLLDHGADIDGTNGRGLTALCMAERMKPPAPDIARALRRRGARESTCRPAWDPIS